MNTLTALSDAEIRQLAKQNAAEGKLLNPHPINAREPVSVFFDQFSAV